MHPSDNQTSLPLPAWVAHPFLIYGPRKSGSTLLLNLLDGGARFFVFPSEVKLKFLLAEFINGQSLYGTYYQKSEILGKEFPGFDSQRYARLVSDAVEGMPGNVRDMLCLDAVRVHECMQQKPAAVATWGMKEVGGPTGQILRFFRHLFPHGRIVMIFRDPLMVARATLLDRRRKGIRLRATGIVREIVDPIRVCQEQFRFAKDGTVHALSYESLTKQTREEMMAICRYLGVEHEDILERPTICRNDVVVKTASINTQTVFENSYKWYQGLTLRERLLVWLGKQGYELYLVLRGRKVVPYSSMLEHLKARRPIGVSPAWPFDHRPASANS